MILKCVRVRMYVFEVSVVEGWGHNRHTAVPVQDAEQLLTSGSHPGPMAELEFWKDRSENLDHLEVAVLHVVQGGGGGGSVPEPTPTAWAGGSGGRGGFFFGF